MAPPPSSERALLAALDGYDRLVEVGVGRRPGVARALANGGREVVAFDVAVADAARQAAGETRASEQGSLHVVAADVTALAAAGDDRAVHDALGLGPRAGDVGEAPDLTDGVRVDAVYARNLPAELQRPTVALAERLDADCLFTTLGFEEPVVGVSRRASAARTVVYVAR